MTTTSKLETAEHRHRGDDYFDDWAKIVHEWAKTFKGQTLFRVDGGELYLRFIGKLPADCRQAHRCHACRHFFERYGNLVTIDKNGELDSIFWAGNRNVPKVYRKAHAALWARVIGAPVKGIFYSEEKRWGTPKTGEWRHFGLTSLNVYKNPLLNASQAMAEKEEEHKMLQRALADFREDIAEKAVAISNADILYRGEKVQGVARWFFELHQSLPRFSKEKRANILWRAVAEAPKGFAHVRSTMIGTLLQDLKDGLSVDAAAARFKEKMHPLQYQRPTAPPKEGAIDAAEKLVCKLGVEKSLVRRFARLEDIHMLWRPKERERKSEGGIFAHLRRDEIEREMKVSGVTELTWVKFARDILPNVVEMTCLIPYRGPFTTLVTAEYPSAPPILKWDHEDERNPVSWYFWHGGASAVDYNLNSHSWVEVRGISLSPAKWSDRPSHGEANMAIFYLNGARDMRAASGRGGGGGLFPENLKAEYHGIRSVIEAHSNSSPLHSTGGNDACGLVVSDKAAPDQKLTVNCSTGKLSMTYRIDRWE